ncbi:MAG: DUF4245 family protein [Nocardioides sp.]|nr:DUF4245 family protein [Nocardioides sp.]
MSDSEKPGRYARSAGGLLVSLGVTVLAVLAFVAFRAVTTEDLVVRPEPVDYLDTVELAQDSDLQIVYPPSLPDGWIATNVAVVPGDRPAFGLSILTDDETFIGVRQEDASLADLLTTYVDEEAREEDPTQFDSPIATTWETYSDEGGDLAYATEVGDDTLLVYGSAGADDLRLLLESLTTDPL